MKRLLFIIVIIGFLIKGLTIQLKNQRMRYLSFMLAFFIANSLFSQIGYKKTFEVCDDNTSGINVHPLSKGELVVSRQLLGRCISFIKLDEKGNEIQNVEYFLKDSFQTAFANQGSIIDKNGDLVLAIPYNNYFPVDTYFFDIRLSKIDTATLKEKWVRQYKTMANESSIVIQETEQGYRLMLQKAYPYWNGQVWFADEIYMSFEEFDYDGNPLQKTEISPVGERYNWSTSFTERVDEKAVIGYNAGSRSTVQSQFISLVDSNYNVVWTKDISARFADQPPNVAISLDRSFIYATGYKSEHNIQGLDWSESGKVYTYSFNGRLEWERSLLTEIGGYSIENAKHGRMSLLNPDGTVVWDNRYQLDNIGGSTSKLYDIQESDDGSIIGIGNTSRPFEINELLVIKVDRATGCLDENCEELVNPAPTPTLSSNVSSEQSSSIVQVYPNPSSGQINIEFESPLHSEMRLIVQGISGRILRQIELPRNTQRKFFSLESGVYFYSISSESGVVRHGKLVVIK